MEKDNAAGKREEEKKAKYDQEIVMGELSPNSISLVFI